MSTSQKGDGLLLVLPSALPQGLPETEAKAAEAPQAEGLQAEVPVPGTKEDRLLPEAGGGRLHRDFPYLRLTLSVLVLLWRLL